MTSFAGFVTHLTLGGIDFVVMLIFVAGSTVGVLSGTRLANRVSGQKLDRAFGIFTIFVALFLIYTNILAWFKTVSVSNLICLLLRLTILKVKSGEISWLKNFNWTCYFRYSCVFCNDKKNWTYSACLWYQWCHYILHEKTRFFPIYETETYLNGLYPHRVRCYSACCERLLVALIGLPEATRFWKTKRA